VGTVTAVCCMHTHKRVLLLRNLEREATDLRRRAVQDAGAARLQAKYTRHSEPNTGNLSAGEDRMLLLTACRHTSLHRRVRLRLSRRSRHEKVMLSTYQAVEAPTHVYCEERCHAALQMVTSKIFALTQSVIRPNAKKKKN
jgi:hypothetical protein